MTDRTPTKILNNGAIRYGVYDDAGTLLRYEYIKLEDEPTQAGMPLNKASLLPDDVCNLLGISTESLPKDALNKLKSFIDTARSEAYSAQSTANGRAQIEYGSFSVKANTNVTINTAGTLKILFLMTDGYVCSPFMKDSLCTFAYVGSGNYTFISDKWVSWTSSSATTRFDDDRTVYWAAITI